MTATVPQTLQLAVALQQAIAHHQAGRLQDAERLYRAILQAQPDHSDANHNLGVLAVQVKQPVAGLPHFKAALEANPNQGQYWLSYINALIQSGHFDAARQVLGQGRQRGLQGVVVDGLAGRLEEGAQVAEQISNELLPVSSTVPQASNNKLKHQSAKKSAMHQKKNPGAQEINTLAALFTEGRYTEEKKVRKKKKKGVRTLNILTAGVS